MDFYGRNINSKESKQIVQVEDYGKILIVGWLKPPYVTILVMDKVGLFVSWSLRSLNIQ
jgi:hypothetical protein